ncbi:MAG: OmpA family protein [Mycobacterium sp.]
MTGSGEKRVTATATEWRAESRYYRRSPGLGWLLGLALIPLLLGWLGWGVLKPKVPDINLTAPSVSVSVPSVSVPNVSVPSVAAAASCDQLQATINKDLAGPPIKFVTDGYALDPSDSAELDPIAAAIKACPTAKVTVIGHTDNTGNDAINNPLSANRAKAVADYRVSQGVSADAVASKGAGSSEPVASNDTEEGRTQNRRTEIKVS